MTDKTGENCPPVDLAGTGYAVPVLIGIIGGFIAVVIPLWIGIVTSGTIYTVMLHEFFAKYAHHISKIPQIQVFLIFLFGTLFLGFLIPCIYRQYIQKITDAIRVGIISGACTGIVLTCFFMLMPGIFHDNFHIGNQYLFLEVSVLLLSPVFEIIGAIGGYLWYKNRMSVPLSDDTYHLPVFAIPVAVMIILMGLVFIVPMTFPTIEWKDCWGYPDAVTMERLDSDTVRITQITQNSPDNCSTDKPFINKISLDGKDVSNQAIIKLQNLSDTIDPSEGLVYAKGSQVILKGPDFSNKSYKSILQVIVFMQAPDNTMEIVHYSGGYINFNENGE